MKTAPDASRSQTTARWFHISRWNPRRAACRNASLRISFATTRATRFILSVRRCQRVSFFFCFLFRATSIPVSPPAAHLFARSSSCRVGDQLNFTCNPLLRWYIELPLSLSQTCGVLIYFKYILRYEIHLIFCTVFQNWNVWSDVKWDFYTSFSQWTFTQLIIFKIFYT